MSIASLFRLAPAPVVATGGRHAAPETENEERPPSTPAPDRGPGRHAAPEDVEPALDTAADTAVDTEVQADVQASLLADLDHDEDLLASLGFAYAD